jgi:hypothetical protein
MGNDLPHAQHSEVTPALLWIEKDQERSLREGMGAAEHSFDGKPYDTAAEKCA